MSTATIPCEWFLMCTNSAHMAMFAGPVLGWVPICDRCASRAENAGAGTIEIEIVED